MAYITNKKRNSLVKSINGSYTFRKILILITVILTLGFIAITVVSFWKWLEAGASVTTGTPRDVLEAQINQGWSWFQLVGESWTEEELTFTLSPLGWGMVVWAAIILLGSVFSVILTFTMKSPKAVRKEVKTLESAALSGKKLTSKDISTHIMKERTSKISKKPKK